METLENIYLAVVRFRPWLAYRKARREFESAARAYALARLERQRSRAHFDKFKDAYRDMVRANGKLRRAG